MDQVREFDWRPTPVAATVIPMTTDRERVISVSLTEAEWQALVERHPEPHHWLREQVLSQIDLPAGQESVATVTAAQPHISTRGRV